MPGAWAPGSTPAAATVLSLSHNAGAGSRDVAESKVERYKLRIEKTLPAVRGGLSEYQTFSLIRAALPVRPRR